MVLLEKKYFSNINRYVLVTTAESKEGDSTATKPATQLSGDTMNPIYSPGDTNSHPSFSGENDTYQEPQTDVDMNPIYSPVDDIPNSFPFGDEATYEEPKTGDSRECELYEPGENNLYDQCADDEQNGKRPPPHEDAYDYAKSEDVRLVAQRLQAGDQTCDHVLDAQSKVLNGNNQQGYDQSPVYEMLEGT